MKSEILFHHRRSEFWFGTAQVSSDNPTRAARQHELLLIGPTAPYNAPIFHPLGGIPTYRTIFRHTERSLMVICYSQLVANSVVGQTRTQNPEHGDRNWSDQPLLPPLPLFWHHHNDDYVCFVCKIEYSQSWKYGDHLA